MLIRYSDGSFVEAIIHRLQGGCIRAAIPDADDEVEYRLINDEWFSESGLAVTFEFAERLPAELLLISSANLNHMSGGCAAGGDCVLRRISPPGALAS